MITLLGRNGRGRSTTVKWLFGMLPVTAGTFEVAGVSGAQEPRLFGGEDAAAVFGFVTACGGDVMSTSFG